jgi:hypothetical protein
MKEDISASASSALPESAAVDADHFEELPAKPSN